MNTKCKSPHAKGASNLREKEFGIFSSSSALRDPSAHKFAQDDNNRDKI